MADRGEKEDIIDDLMDRLCADVLDNNDYDRLFKALKKLNQSEIFLMQKVVFHLRNKILNKE